MSFLKNQKVKSKLRMPVYLYLVLLLIIAYFYLGIRGEFSGSSDGGGQGLAIVAKINAFSGSVSGWLESKGNKSNSALDGQYQEIVKLTAGKMPAGKTDALNALGKDFEQVNTLFQNNKQLEGQVEQATGESIKQCDDLIRQAGGKLADADLRGSVSDQERSMVVTASSYSGALFRLKILFLKAGEDPQAGGQLTSQADQLIKNAQADETRLADTPFAPLAKKTKETSQTIKTSAATTIENLKTLTQLKEKFSLTFDDMSAYLMKNQTLKTGQTWDVLNDYFFKLFIALIIIGLLLMALSSAMTRWFTASLNGMLERSYDLAVDNVDLTRRLTVHSKDEFGELTGWFNKFLERVNLLILKVKEDVQQVHVSAEDVRMGSEELASRTHEQAASITETSTTLEQFAAAIRDNTENSAEADMMLLDFNSEIQEKSGLIDNVTHTMTEIFDSSKQIDSIIKVINDISFQTNLLALNAAVEAARAGEAGRGFAVVASEVRNLAQKTAESSKSIQDIVLRNVESTQKGMALVKDTSEFFNQIVGVMGEIVEKISNITNVSREQANGIEQVSDTIGQMDKSSSQNAKLVERLADAGHSVEQKVTELQNLITPFKVDESSDIKGSDYFTEVVMKDKKKDGIADGESKRPSRKTKETIPKKRTGSKGKKKEGAAAQNEKGDTAPAPTEDDFFGNDEDGFDEF